MLNTTICVGPIAAPVRTYAVIDDDRTAFHLYHVHEDGGAARIRMPRTCEGCGATGLEQADLARGVEYGEDGYILVDDEELAALRPDYGTDYTVSSFCDPDEITAMLYDKPYALEPDVARGKSAALKSYALLRRALELTGKVGLVKYTSRGTSKAAALRVDEVGGKAVLVLQNLRWTDQLRQLEFDNLPSVTELNEQELDMTVKFVELYTKEFDPDEFVSGQAVRVAELIEAKAAGRVFVPTAKTSVVPEDVSDLLARLQVAVEAREAALEQSVEDHPAKGKKASKAAKKTA
jgi:DNA end-binding protein Ku